ncbi:MAG TPA: CAP domain-containing protein [Methanoregula sp.]|nr:CAP domain-containing protein [Methanoregula sp.]
MKWSRLFVIFSLLSAGLVILFLINGTFVWSGSQLAEQLRGEPPAGPPAHTISPAPGASNIPVTPSPAQETEKTAEPTPVPSEKSMPLPPFPAADIISAAQNPFTISTDALEQRVHDLINQQRTARGLASLRFDPALADIARKHSEDMAAQDYFAHVNPAGQNPTARGIAAGYTCRKVYGSYYTYGIAENLFQNNLYSSATYYSNRETVYAWNSPEEIAQTTVGGWMNSSGHRENIVTPTYDREGIGVAIAADNKVYITEDFC